MASGYNVLWTDYALRELAITYNYLIENFSERELRNLSKEIQNTLRLISVNPELFPDSAKNGIRKVVVKKYNTMYYWIKNDTVEILSFYSNRQKTSKYNFRP